MRSKVLIAIAAMLILAFALGCSQQRANPPAKENVEQALQQSGMNNINVDENRDKGVITLKGEVRTEAEKQRAGELAQQAAPGRVVANELLVKPAGEAGERAEDTQSSMDDAIQSRLKAEMTKRGWDKLDVNFDVKNGVVTLKGDVPSQQQRAQVEKVAASVPGVKQVVNELEIQNRKGAGGGGERR
jgi:hyperosmotically inducible protein